MEQEWVWASEPTGKFGRVRIYKKYLNKKEIKEKQVRELLEARQDSKEDIVEIRQQLANLIPIKKKEKMETSGVYAIICEIEKCAYIGQSINIGSRLRNHKMSILSNTSKCEKTYIKIREHRKKHGIDAFQFIAIHPMPFASTDELLSKEGESMLQYCKNGYTLYNTTIHIVAHKELIHCPIQFQPTIIEIIKALDSLSISELKLKELL